METAVLTVELIFFILATFFMGYMAINHIILDIKERKQRQKLDEAISEFCDKISNHWVKTGKYFPEAVALMNALKEVKDANTN